MSPGHSDYTPKLQCAQLHTRLAAIYVYNYRRIRHRLHITIKGSTQDKTREGGGEERKRERENQFPYTVRYGMTTSTPSEEHTYHTYGHSQYSLRITPINTHKQLTPICFAPQIRTRHPQHRSTLHSNTIFAHQEAQIDAKLTRYPPTS